MRARLKSWGHTIWQRKWWFIFLLVYKIIEDWGLGKLIGYIEEQEGIWVNISDFIINYLPWVTWIAIPITILILIVKAWLDSSRLQVTTVLATTQNRRCSPQVLEQLNGLIVGGEVLANYMRRSDFHVGQLSQSVHEWLDNVEKDVWEVLPDYAGYITAEQGGITEDEKMRYSGWDWGAASLRISVDRRLARLRETRSQIQAPDKEDYQA